MKIYISADYEGISGVAGERQTSTEGRDYDRTRKLQAQDVNAAIEGAMKAGAREFVVNDSHGGMNNLWPEDLHPAAQLLIGTKKPLSMMQGIDESFDAAFFIGYHAKAGTQAGTLAHTYTGTIVNARINDRTVGEVEINGALAGFFNVPLVLVTGDNELGKQVGDFQSSIETVAVKQGVSRAAALCMHPEKAHDLIRQGAKKAVENRKDIQPVKFDLPVSVEVDFTGTQIADILERIPGVERIGEKSLRYVARKNYMEAFKAFLTLMTMSGTAKTL